MVKVERLSENRIKLVVTVSAEQFDLALDAAFNKVVKDVKSEGSSTSQAKLIKQLKRLERLGGDQSINSTEGIVFKYKGRLMKLTGSFAPLNKLLHASK